jgi:hypothetical protein
MVGYGLDNCQEHTSFVHVNGLGLTLCVNVYLIMKFIGSVPNLGYEQWRELILDGYRRRRI